MADSSVSGGSASTWSPPAGSIEPMVQEWHRAEPVHVLSALGVVPGTTGRMVVALDGRSGSGKSTLAARLQALMPDTVVLATDDVAWHFSMFGWANELADNVLLPYRQGHAVCYRPPGWRERGRPGALEVPATTRVLLVEGVGASRVELGALLDAAVWVQSDYQQARERCLARDVASGVNGDAAAAAAFWEEWQREENPFLERDRPWTRADLVVAGVPLAARGIWVSPGAGAA